MSHRNRRNRFLRSASTPYTRVTLADGTDATPKEDSGGNIVSAAGKLVEPSSARGRRRFFANRSIPRGM